MSALHALGQAADAAMALFGLAQQWLFEGLVQPAMYGVGLASFLSDAYNATGWLLVGLMQIAVMLLVIGPLQRWRPVEPWSADAVGRRQIRADVQVDVVYTLIHRLGLFRVAMFFAIDPIWNAGFGWLAVQGVDGWHLDQWIAPLWPGLSDSALAGFLAYLVCVNLMFIGTRMLAEGRLPGLLGLWWLTLPLLALSVWLYLRDGRLARPRRVAA